MKLLNYYADRCKCRRLARLKEGLQVIREASCRNIQEIVPVLLHMLGPRLREGRTGPEKEWHDFGLLDHEWDG